MLCKIKRCLFSGGYCLGSSLADEPLCPPSRGHRAQRHREGAGKLAYFCHWQKGAVLEEMLHRVPALSLLS